MPDGNNTGFDAANFLDNYREDIATPVRKNKRQPKQPLAAESSSQDMEPNPTKAEQTSNRPPTSNYSAATTGCTVSAEDNYTHEYLVERVPIGFSKSGWQVAVSDANHDRIVKIIAILGVRLTLGGFVDNILRKHFDENKDTIRNLISKHTEF